jgi:hypothetical protein
LWTLIEHSKEKKTTLFLFMDFKKVFDIVSHEMLW